jgi:hypothetical protein
MSHHRQEPAHDYIDFRVGVPAKFWPLSLPKNQVIVRVEPTTGLIYSSDLRKTAADSESGFVEAVRQSIQQAVQSSYDVSLDIRKQEVTATQCFLASWP